MAALWAVLATSVRGNAMALKHISIGNGNVLDEETYKYVQLLSIQVGYNVIEYITNGSYDTDVAASGSTHKGSGAFDLSGSRLSEAKLTQAVSAWRRLTAGRGTAWVRLPSQGNWKLHGHFILVNAESDPSAVLQYKNYVKGGARSNGIGGVDDGPRDWVGATGTIPVGGALTNISTDAPATSVSSIFDIYKLIADPDFIRRALYFVVGVLLIIVGTYRITAKTLPLDLLTKIGK